MTCSNCGAELTAGIGFCTNCGASIQPGAAAPAPAKPTPVPVPVAAPPPVAPPARQADVKAIFSLILGILAIVPFSILAGIPAIILGYLAKRSIRDSDEPLGGNGMATAGLVLGYLSCVILVAAVAIPNLIVAMRTPGVENYTSNLRLLNTAQVNYTTMYPEHGFARDLASLGPGPGQNSDRNCTPAPAHACIIDSMLGAPQCTSGVWCNSQGHRYALVAVCPGDVCTDYVATATYIERGYYHRNFCSTSDAVIRFEEGDPLVTPLTDPSECKAWIPLQ